MMADTTVGNPLDQVTGLTDKQRAMDPRKRLDVQMKRSIARRTRLQMSRDVVEYEYGQCGMSERQIALLTAEFEEADDEIRKLTAAGVRTYSKVLRENYLRTVNS